MQVVTQAFKVMIKGFAVLFLFFLLLYDGAVLRRSAAVVQLQGFYYVIRYCFYSTSSFAGTCIADNCCKVCNC